ncbi:MAG TPA: acyl-CoA dehydrogenase, partial [Polyangiaceae bacterium]
CLGANALRAAKAGGEHLRRVEAGEALATMVTSGSIAALPGPAGSFVLSGEAAGVVNGHTADFFVVRAGAPEPSLFVVETRSRGLTCTRTAALDATRPLATLTLRDVVVAASARIGDERAASIALDRAAIALAAESLGGAERCLEMATDYAKTRVQFDRPIGSFQAIKHRLADMFVTVEMARSAVYWAASVAASGGAAELHVAAAIAKSQCTEAFFRCAAEGLQVHGGIGFTWEHDVHLFLRRARSSLTLLGSPSKDREAVMVEVDAWT